MELPEGVEMVTGRGGLEAVRVETDLGRGEVYRHGAHVTSWLPAGQTRDVLFLSERATFAQGKAIRGGIPLCGPWFGAGPDGDRSPSHGFFRTSEWTLLGAQRAGGAVDVAFGLDGRPHGFDLSAQFRVRFGPSLFLALTVTSGDGPFDQLEGLFHAYLAVGDVHDVEVTGLEGAHYRDKSDEGRDGDQQGPVRFTGEVDRIYTHNGGVELTDPELGRRITVETSGTDRFVVWNPWETKASRLADMEPGGWTRYVCLEPGNVDTGAVAVPPDSSMFIAAAISVENLQPARP